MTPVDKQEKKSATITSTANNQPLTLKESSFCYNFSAKPKGETYYISRGNTGFLDLCAVPFYAGETQVTIQLPESVELSLYMLNSLEKRCTLIKPAKTLSIPPEKKVCYNVSKSFCWLAGGNGLFIRPGVATPEKFNVSIEFETANSKFKVNVPVAVLGEDTPIVLPKNFSCYAYYGFPLPRIGVYDTDQDKLPAELFRKWVSAGFMGGGGGSIPGRPEWTPIWEFASTVFPLRVTDPSAKNKAFLTAAQTVSGSPGTLICPSVLIDQGAPFFIECIKKIGWEEKIKAPNAICEVDYEVYCDGWTTAMCFCPECIKNFAVFAKLDPLGLSPRKILTQYEKQWVKFRCMQNSQVVKAMADAVHQINPQAKFMLCSMPQAAKGEEEDYLKRYGIDLTLYESFIDVHTPMIYNTDMLFYQRLQACFENLKKPVWPYISSGWGPIAPYNPKRYRLQLLTSAVLGAKGAKRGVMVYSGVFQMDDAYFKSHREVMQNIAKIEDNYLVNGEIDKTTAEVIPQFGAKGNFFSVARSNNEKYLVFVCNNSEKEKIFVKVKLNVKEGNFQVRELNSNALVKTGKDRNSITAAELKNGITMVMLPLDYLLLEITPASSSAADANGPEIMASEIAAMNENEITQFNSKLKLHQENGFKIGTIKKDWKLFYLIENNLNRLTVSLDNSATAEWMVSQNNSFSTAMKEAGIDIFAFPSLYCAKDVKAELKDFKIKGDVAEATFSYSITKAPFDGLRVEKTYYIHKNIPELKIKVVIIPEKGYRQFVYRTTNSLGISDNAEDICYQIPDGKETKTEKYAGKDSSALDFGKNGKTPLLKNYAKKTGSFDGTWCLAWNTKNNTAVKTTFDDRVDELFLWRDGNCATVEWVYAKPYQDNDPHKAAPWEINYSFKYIPANSQNIDIK